MAAGLSRKLRQSGAGTADPRQVSSRSPPGSPVPRSASSSRLAGSALRNLPMPPCTIPPRQKLAVPSELDVMFILEGR
jgi:hypothetical protein